MSVQYRLAEFPTGKRQENLWVVRANLVNWFQCSRNLSFLNVTHLVDSEEVAAHCQMPSLPLPLLIARGEEDEAEKR